MTTIQILDKGRPANMNDTARNTPELISHVLRLVDPGPGAGVIPDLPVAIGSLLSTGKLGWSSTKIEDEAIVFPSWALAHRFAKRFLVTTEQTWLPTAVPHLAPNIPATGTACRSCGCTESFACPSRCAWHEPDLCTECVSSDDLVMYVIYDKPSDHPDSAIARKHLGGVPTNEILAAATVDELRRLMPRDAISLPRHPSDAGSIVETWIV